MVRVIGVLVSGAGSNLQALIDAHGGLAAGAYTVSVATPAGFVATPSQAAGSTSSNDSNGSPAAVTLATNTSSDLSIDIGFTKGAGVIGDFVWDDLNGNGVQDAGEAVPETGGGSGAR